MSKYMFCSVSRAQTALCVSKRHKKMCTFLQHHCRASKGKGAHLAMLCSELDGLQQTQRLIHTAPNGHVVDGGLLQNPLRVDDEQAPQSYPLVLHQDAIPGCNLLQSRAYRSYLVVVSSVNTAAQTTGSVMLFASSQR